MRRMAWGAMLLLACPFGSGAEAPPPSLDFGVYAQVDVSSDGRARVVEMGKVSKLSDVPTLVPIAESIAQRLRQRIETWQFVPATKNGVPVESATGVYVGLEGSDDGRGGLAVRIRAASTGGELRDANILGLRIAVTKAQEDGRITVDVAYDDTGKVVSVSEYESKSFEHGRFVKAASRELRKFVLDAVKRWKFVPETIDGQRIAGKGRVPIRLCVTDACIAARDENGDTGDGTRFAAIDPAVKLRSAVAGTAL